MICGICGEARWGAIMSRLIELPDYADPVAICFDCNLKRRACLAGRQGKTWIEEHHPFGRAVRFTIKVSRNEHEMMHVSMRLTWDKEECTGKTLKAVERLRQDIYKVITDNDRQKTAISALADYERRLKC